MDAKSCPKIIGEYQQPILVRVCELTIDDGEGSTNYQRVVRPMFAFWNWEIYDPIRVGKRHGEVACFHVIDGGRRVRESKRFGISELPAFVQQSGGYASEAKEFMDVAKAKKPLSAMDRHRASVVAGEPRAVAISQVCEKYGIQITNSPQWPCLRVVTALYRVELSGLDFAFGVIKELWNGDVDALREPVVVGLAKFYSQSEKLDRDRMIKRLSLLSPIAICRKSSGMPAGTNYHTQFAKVFADIYAKRK